MLCDFQIFHSWFLPGSDLPSGKISLVYCILDLTNLFAVSGDVNLQVCGFLKLICKLCLGSEACRNDYRICRKCFCTPKRSVITAVFPSTLSSRCPVMTCTPAFSSDMR